MPISPRVTLYKTLNFISKYKKITNITAKFIFFQNTKITYFFKIPKSLNFISKYKKCNALKLILLYQKYLQLFFKNKKIVSHRFILQCLCFKSCNIIYCILSYIMSGPLIYWKYRQHIRNTLNFMSKYQKPSTLMQSTTTFFSTYGEIPSILFQNTKKHQHYCKVQQCFFFLLYQNTIKVLPK